MSRYNLLDERWIPVILDDSGQVEYVSLVELFKNAENYLALGGDTQTQKFALLRFILSIPQTVYFRFDRDGESYQFFDVDEKMRQIEDVDEEDVHKFRGELVTTWKDLWEDVQYSDVLFKYLEIWRDRFYLFDDRYPFYQVTEDVITGDNINRKNPTTISGKLINRVISESNNKVGLFAPKFANRRNKEYLTEDEVARWLIMFQGYVGTSDKVMFNVEGYTASKGWIYDIGGIYLEGDNLFETLMLNTMLGQEDQFYYEKQKPCWEYTGREVVDRLLLGEEPDNLAELYTNWSRAINIDPEVDLDKPFEMKVVKVPEIDHRDQFLEPMTLWRNNTTGENKGHHTPRKHQVNQSMWRNFGLIFSEKSGDEVIIPGIIKWYDFLSQYMFKDKVITINSISMEADGNATSWMPVGEVYDSLNLHDIVITDDKEGGWTDRVNDAVELTKESISRTYRRFIRDLLEIRNIDSREIVDQYVEQMYFAVDYPFRQWIQSIDSTSNKEEKMLEWKNTLKDLIESSAEEIVEEAGPRDYTGIEKDGRIKNIGTIYSSFKYFLNKNFKTKEVYHGENQ